MRSFQPKHHRSVHRRLPAVMIGSVLAIGSIACSDDKSEVPPGASAESSGGESSAERVNRRANEAHGEFKEEVKPAAQWVDEKSRRVVEEVKSAVHKADDALHDDDKSTSAPPASKPAAGAAGSGAGSAVAPAAAAAQPQPPAASKPAPVPDPATPK